ncbi:MAG: hypothetical protein AAF485_21450, partial [Chloroflexota bacterium]
MNRTLCERTGNALLIIYHALHYFSAQFRAPALQGQGNFLLYKEIEESLNQLKGLVVSVVNELKGCENDLDKVVNHSSPILDPQYVQRSQELLLTLHGEILRLEADPPLSHIEKFLFDTLKHIYQLVGKIEKGLVLLNE